MADVQFSQFDIEALQVGGDISVSYIDFDTVFNTPSLQLDISALDLDLITTATPVPVDISQLDLEVVYRGRIDDPKIRLWAFTLDGHDMVVVRLGGVETLVVDVTTEQFYLWGSEDVDLWRAYDGCNWIGGSRLGATYGSNVVVGDDGNGSLYFLSPDTDTDDHPLMADQPVTYRREATGQVLTKGYAARPCYDVELLGSIGQLSNDNLTSVELLISDDRGGTYQSMGLVNAEDGEWYTRMNWRSLGSIRAPGRLFKIKDYGALRRIDSLDMIGEEDRGQE